MNLDAFDALVRITLAGTAAILVVLLARRFLRQRFGALVAYVAWTLVPTAVVAMLLPAPAHPVAAFAGIVRVAPLQAAPAAVVVDSFDPRWALFALWLGGALLAAAWFAQQQRRYLCSLGRLQAREGGRVVQSDSEFAGPALVDAWRPRIVLPSDFDRRYDARERELILAHEQVHFVRGDAWVNAFVVALRSLNWFNPLLHYAAAKFRIDQELACDAAVVARFPEARRQYADAMLKVQLAGQPRQELRLPVGCRWPSDRTLKERILMLKQSRPTRATRIAGFALVAATMLSFAWTAWASQSSRPATVPAAGRSVDATLRLDVDGKTGKPVQVIHELGSEFEVADGDWRATMIANATEGDDVALDTTLRKNGRVVSAPSVVAKQGKPFSVAVGKAGHDDFRVEGTLVLLAANKSAAATPATSQAPADEDVTYRSMAAPKYPDDAIKSRVQADVYVKVQVAADGSVLSAHVDHVKPDSAAASAGSLGDAAVAAVKSWHFNPARKSGVPVDSWVMVPITFSLNGQSAATTTPAGDGQPMLDPLTVTPPEKH